MGGLRLQRFQEASWLRVDCEVLGSLQDDTGGLMHRYYWVGPLDLYGGGGAADAGRGSLFFQTTAPV